MPPIQSTFSWSIFLSLLITFIVSTMMFWILALRDTLWRARLRLHDWADDRGFVLDEQHHPPHHDALLALEPHRPTVEMELTGGESALLRMMADALPAHRTQADRQQWHLLVRHSGGNWRCCALRPIQAPRSIRDYFNLNDYPSVLTPERFTACGLDRRAAAALAASAAVRLLPPDIGLLLIGPALILDFSSRAFDSIEFDRMLAISDQLVRQLPVMAA